MQLDRVNYIKVLYSVITIRPTCYNGYCTLIDWHFRTDSDEIDVYTFKEENGKGIIPSRIIVSYD